MDIITTAAQRFTTKVYDATRKLSAEQQDAIISLLQNSPSSLNLQPWHFHIITSDAGKAQIAPAIYPLNSEKVADAPFIVVFSTQNNLTDQHIADVLAQEYKDGRFADAAARDKYDAGRRGYVNNNVSDPAIQRPWMEKQAYIALGFLLLGAPALGLQATPIEGFDREKMDQQLNLEAQGLHSIVMATVGYNSDADFNAALPKSRLTRDKIVTTL